MDSNAPSPQALRPERHVVFVNPEIHWNTGNAGRTCLAVGARLHLIKPLGFSLDGKQVRRAGLDYWPAVDLALWNSFDEMIAAMAPQESEVAVFSKTGSRRARYAASTFYIPITDRTRSLNLSTAAAVALYESLRGAPSFHGWPISG